MSSSWGQLHPSGNLGEVTKINECEYDIKIRPDTNNDRHRLWFYFCVTNVQAQQQVLLNIVNFSKKKSLYREGLAPVVLYYRCPKGPGNRLAYVMSFLFQFDGANDAPYYFAYAYPYTYTDLQRFLYGLERRGLPFFHRESLCRTLQLRKLELVTITAPEDEAGARPIRDRTWVFMSARVHPGETPSQFIVHGVIDFLTGNSPRARALRANIVFKIVPMLNPDGVVNGNYRCSYLGFDLNRHWLDPSAWGQPEILAVKSLVAKLHEDPLVDFDLYIDIHAHSVGTNSFMYGNNIPARRKHPPLKATHATSGSAGEAQASLVDRNPASPTRTETAASPSQQNLHACHGEPSGRGSSPLASPPRSSSTAWETPATPGTDFSKEKGQTPQVPRESDEHLSPEAQPNYDGDVNDDVRRAGSARTIRSVVAAGSDRGSGGGLRGGDATADPFAGDLAVFPKLLAVNAPDFSFARSRVDADPSKEGTGRRALGQLLSPDVLCFTLEVSFYASQREDIGLVPYTRAGYIDLGRSLASTFFDYYRLA